VRIAVSAHYRTLFIVCQMPRPRTRPAARRGPLSRNASREAASLLREAILDGRVRPGERLKEQQLAEAFGISRTPVREALLFLEAEGAVELIPNRGATVRTYTMAEIEETYQLRALLEGYACRRAAERSDAGLVEELRRSNRRFARLRVGKDLAQLAKENHLFHNTILEAADSERLSAMVRGVIELPLIYKSFFWYSPGQKHFSEHYHEQITRALEGRDGERAEFLMKEHVYEARDFLVTRLREESPEPEET
jgi:DNA-binding GntR family transcriptional regulator